MAVESRGDLESRHGRIGRHRRGAFRVLSLRQSYLHQNPLKGGLVSTGPYDFTRNPQYLGDIVCFVGVECNSRTRNCCGSRTF